MISQKNITVAFIKPASFVDVITNSSSELFVIKAEKKREVVFEMVSNALEGITKIRLEDLQIRLFEGEHNSYDEEWMKEDILSKFPEHKRAEVEKLFEPSYYALVFDRDWGYPDYVHHDILRELGFELLTSDY